MGIAAQVLFHAYHAPDRPALGFSGVTATYGMIGRGVTSTCAAIRRSGIAPGSRVAIDVGNPIHHVALILALELCGITSLSVHTRHALAASGLNVDALLIDASGAPDPQLCTLVVSDDWFAMAPAIDIRGCPGIGDDQYYRIVLSSGTTGHPKAVGYKPSLIERAFMRTAIVQSEAAPRCLNMLGFATRAVLWPLFTLIQGGSAYFASSLEDTLSTIRANQVSRIAFTGVAHLEALVACARSAASPLPSLRAIHVAGDKLPPSLAKEARMRLCANIITSYASTEAGVLTYGRVGDADEIEGAAGYGVPWVEIGAADSSENALTCGAEGLIRVKTPDLAEYVLDTAGQLDPLKWFYTGDVGFVRKDGLLVITGRTAEVINRRGIIVAPDYIEKVLLAHPSIREAAAFAHLDAAGREEIWAAVVADEVVNPIEVLESCRSSLGDKTPDRLHQVDVLPRTDTGKVKRNALRQRFINA